MDGVIKEDEIEPSGNMYRIRYSRDEWNRFNYNFIPWWQDRNTQHIEAKIDLTSQLNKYNQIKTGGFLRRYNLKLTEIQFINPNPYTDRYEKQPLAGAFYIQDKIEFEDLTTNLGVRADYFDPNSEFYVDLEHPIEMDKAKPKIQVSPRFGISFSVTDKSLMYANYGHFFQVIDLEDMYQNLQGDLTAGYVLIGNPDIPPQRTIAYEVGFKHLLTPDIRFDVTGYLKDVDNLLATREIKTLVIDKLFDYTVYEPVDFAIVKGFEIGIIKRPSEFISGSIGYAYMDAKGTGSSGREFYYRYRDTEAEIPTREYPLEFDVTHTLKAGINLYLPDGFGPILFGLKPLSNFNTNVQYNFSSGPPYTPTDERDNPLEEGSKRLPATSTLDLRMDKTLFFGPIPLGVFLDVRNLLDKKNVVDIYTRTGIPDDNGERPVWDERYYTSRYEERGYSSPEEMWRADLENWKRYVDTPANYGNPRIIRFGVLFNF
jgi:hypothetical protein